MKKLFLLIILTFTLVSCFTIKSKYCVDCGALQKSIRFYNNIEGLQYNLYRRINCPYCHPNR